MFSTQGESMLTRQEQRMLDEEFDEEMQFNYDEFFAVEPEIFELIEKKDLSGLQKLLNQIGGF